MASTINASTTGLGGIITTGDNSGALALQTAGTTAVTINSSQNVGIGTTSPTTILQASSATPVITVTSTGLTASSQDFTTNGAAQRTTIGVERSTGGGLFVGSSAYAAVFGSAGASSTQFASNNTVRMTLDTSGNVQTYGTISVGNATPSTSGAGITFPATQSASSDANTLDDYEEGTWTPSTSTSQNITSVTYNSAYYTKIGRQMTITAFLTGTVTTANVLTYVIISLPIVSAFNLDPNTSVAVNASGNCLPGAMIDNTGGNPNTVGMYLPGASVPASGSQTYAFTYTYFTS